MRNKLPCSSDMHIIQNGILNAERYISYIIEEYVVHFTSFIGENLIFQHDKARPHTARVDRMHLYEKNIWAMD